MSEEEKIINKMRQGKFDELNMTKEAIIKSNNLEYILNYAIYSNDKDKEDLQTAIINSGNSKYIYRYALGVKEADINLLADTIVKLGDVKTIILFASCIVNSKMDIFTNYILVKTSVETIFNYVVEVKTYKKNQININKIIGYLLLCDKAGQVLYELAKLFPEIDKDLIQSYIINTKDAELIYNFALIYDGDKGLFDETMVEISGIEILSAYYKNVKGINKKFIYNALSEAYETITDFINLTKQETRDKIELLDSNYSESDMEMVSIPDDIDEFMSEAFSNGIVKTYNKYNGLFTKKEIADYMIEMDDGYECYDIYYPFLIGLNMKPDEELALDDLLYYFDCSGSSYKFTFKK